MGLQQSKDELLYEQVSHGTTEGIKRLHSEGAGLEWMDKEGKTPLILASMNPQLYDAAKTLIELGANVNVYRLGCHGGTPLHHAAKSGQEQMVKLLLSHGANALVMNDDFQTALDIARVKGYSNVVRAIENHICLFSGWLQELYGPGFLELLAPQLLSRKVWVVIVPCGAHKLTTPFKLELAIYSALQDAKPRTIIALWKANMDGPNFNEPDSTVIISSSSIPRRWRRKRCIVHSQVRQTRIKLAPVNENEKQQLQLFANACKGISQVRPTAPNIHTTSGSTAPAGSTTVGYLPHTDSNIYSQIIPTAPVNSIAPPSVPTAPPMPAMVDDGMVHYPSIDSTPVDLTETRLAESSSSCVICLDAPVEGACVPCGHMAGCMSCLNEIKNKKFGCPVCRTKIGQIVRIYAV